MRLMPLCLAVFGISFAGFADFARAACDDGLPANGSRSDVLVIVNDNAVDSCEIGLHYAEQRNLGKNNILHVKVPATYYISYAEFQKYRDQVVKALQQRAVQGGGAIAGCTVPADRETTYYCKQSIAQIVAESPIRYLVTVRGVPMMAVGVPSTTGTEPASVDGYLRSNLAVYPANSTGGNIHVGRIDGLTAAAANQLVDRAMAVENKGFYGEFHGIAGGNGANDYLGASGYNQFAPIEYAPVLGSPLMASESLLGTRGSEHWRYFLGLFAENDIDCSGNKPVGSSGTPFYLTSLEGNSSGAGKAPAKCKVKFSLGDGAASDGLDRNDSAPGTAASRIPYPVDAGVMMFNLDGQGTYIETTNSFEKILNWRKSSAMPGLNTLCSPGDTVCIGASEDPFKEIDTRNVGLADGAIGYNLISYPLTYMASWPTKWQPKLASDTTAAASNDTTLYPREWSVQPRIDNTDGSDDSHSVVFASEALPGSTCYSSTALDPLAVEPCSERLALILTQSISYGTAGRTVAVATAPQVNRIIVGLWYKSKQGAGPRVANLTATLATGVQTPGGARQAILGTGTFKNSAQTAIQLGVNQTTWTYATADISLNLSALQQVANTVNLPYLLLSLNSSTQFSGEAKIDAISLVDGDGNAMGLQNATFADGNMEVGVGNWAAIFTSRLNGAAFWGSVTHNCGGQAFGRQAASSVVDFFRGESLGEAIWAREVCSGGVLIGDPLYSPIAVGLLNVPTAVTPLTGIAIRANVENGTDAAHIQTSYSVDYCYGTDFYVCDRTPGAWQATNIFGTQQGRNRSLGVVDASGLSTNQPFVLRLQVTSTNSSTGRSQTFNDFSQPITSYLDDDDTDGDGLKNGPEIAAGTDLNKPDTDLDGFPDGWEHQNGYNPLVKDNGKPDSDSDGLSDEREHYANSDPDNYDTDGDGYSDFLESAYGGNILNSAIKPNMGFVLPPYFVPANRLYSVIIQKTNPANTLVLRPFPISAQGVSFNATTGQLDWTPTSAQRGHRVIGFLVNGAFKAFDVEVVVQDGDLNNDGEFNLADLVLMENLVIGSVQPTQKQIYQADFYPKSEGLQPDDKLDFSDLIVMQKKLMLDPQ